MHEPLAAERLKLHCCSLRKTTLSFQRKAVARWALSFGNKCVELLLAPLGCSGEASLPNAVLKGPEGEEVAAACAAEKQLLQSGVSRRHILFSKYHIGVRVANARCLSENSVNKRPLIGLGKRQSLNQRNFLSSFGWRRSFGDGNTRQINSDSSFDEERAKGRVGVSSAKRCVKRRDVGRGTRLLFEDGNSQASALLFRLHAERQNLHFA